MKFLSTQLYFKLKKDTSEIYTKARNTTITEDFVSRTIHVYTGKRYIPLFISPKMIGYKLGEFCFTKFTGRSIHSSYRNKKKRDKIKARFMAKKVRKSKQGKHAKKKKAKK